MVPLTNRQTYGSNFRWVTESRLFHRGDTGSTPVRVANTSNHLRAPPSHSGVVAHVTLKVTMDTYVQAVSDEKRNAQIVPNV